MKLVLLLERSLYCAFFSQTAYTPYIVRIFEQLLKPAVGTNVLTVPSVKTWVETTGVSARPNSVADSVSSQQVRSPTDWDK